MPRKDIRKEYEKNERERKSPWNVLAFIGFVFMAVLGLVVNGGKTNSIFSSLGKSEEELPGSSKPLLSGDLIFQENPDGAMTDAIEESTGGGFSHVGIVERCPEGLFVLEATTEGGVKRTPLKEFTDGSAHDAKGRPKVAVYRLDNFPVELKDSAIVRAKRYLGKPYDYAYAQGTEALYCSELVWEVFMDEDGGHVFPTVEMNFNGPDWEISPYWTELFAKMGKPVPQGLPGTNPNDLSKSDKLKRIYP